MFVFLFLSFFPFLRGPCSKLSFIFSSPSNMTPGILVPFSWVLKYKVEIWCSSGHIVVGAGVGAEAAGLAGFSPFIPGNSSSLKRKKKRRLRRRREEKAQLYCCCSSSRSRRRQKQLQHTYFKLYTKLVLAGPFLCAGPAAKVKFLRENCTPPLSPCLERYVAVVEGSR